MKNHRLVFLMFILLLFVYQLVAAQNTVERSLGSFKKVKVSLAASIILSEGSSEKISITYQNVAPEDIITEVKGNTLEIYFKKSNKSEKNWYNNYQIKLKLSYKTLEELDLNSACSAKIENIIKGNSFELDINGASSVSLETDVKKLEIEGSGASSIKINGKAQKFEAEISGASSLKALDLQIEDAQFSISGASSTQVWVTQNISADVSGASSLKYKGSPKNKGLNSSGMSSIKQVE